MAHAASADRRANPQPDAMIEPAAEAEASGRGGVSPATDRTGAEAAAGPRGRWGARDLAFVAVFAALIAVFAGLPAIPVGGAGVPITLQTLAIALCGMVLGPARAFLATALYVGLGLIGLPIFSNFSGGLGVLAGPSAGYIAGFAVYALAAGAVAGWAVRRFRGWRLWLSLLIGGLVASFLTVHPLGIAGMAVNLDLTLTQALLADMPFWPGDAVKNAAAAALAVLVHRAFPAVLVRR
ncbi:MAG TPA: biotin transporter BioY [Brevibacterium sp.]|nr:biotin transporter BioY [Brevibacterium sp.]